MRLLAEPIDVVAVFLKGKKPEPKRFKYVSLSGGAREQINVGKILTVTETKKAGAKAIVYLCQSVVGDCEIRYELKYVIEECRWELYKM